MHIVLAASLLVAGAAAPAAAGSVSGRVVGADGRPVAGATVSAHAREPVEEAAERRAAGRTRTPLASARTAADGTFRVDAAGAVASIEARADGFVPAAAALDPDGPTTLTLSKSPLRRGIVRGGGRPLAGALVVWTTSSGAEVITRTAADGSYEAPDPAKAPGHLAIYHPGYAVLWAYAQGSGLENGLDRDLERGTAVSGVVVADGGRAVPDATLWIDDRIPAGRSDAKGAFRIEHAHDGWDYVSARAGGLGGLARRRSGRVVVKVRPAAALSGVVRDAANGQLLAGATVVATNAGVESATVSADTDARGQYAFKALLPGQYRVYAGRSGYVSGPLDYATAEPLDLRAVGSGRRDFALKALPRVRGRVVDPEGRPVDGAMVALGIKSTPHIYARSGNSFGGDSTLTLGDGSFSLVLPDPSAQDSFNPFDKERPLLVLKEGFAAAQVEAAKVAGGGGILVTLTRGVELSGKVTAADGTPLAGVAVSAAEDGSIGGTTIATHVALASPGVEGWTTTDAAGRFALRVHPAVHHLSFRKEGHAPRVVRGHDARRGEPLAVVLDPGAAVRGRVVHADGRGVADVSVTLMDTATMASRSETTAADGSFTIGDLAAGAYHLTATHHELGVQETQTVEAPAEGVQIVLAPRGTVRGRVLEAAGRRPVTRFTVAVAAREGSGRGRSVPVEDAGGAFTVEDVPLGTAYVTVSAEGYGTHRVDDVAVTAEGDGPEIEMLLHPDAVLSGRVTGERGAPVPRARVSAQTEGGSGSAWATSDEEGEFELRGMVAGEITVSVQAGGFLAEKRTVDTRQRTRLEVVLRKGLTLRGEVLSEGAGVPQANVAASSGVRGAGDQSAQADERGRFTLEGLVPGRYTIRASAPGMSTARLEDVDVEQAGLLRLVLERARTAVVTGKVVGVPMAEEPAVVMVMATNADGTAAQAMVDAAHAFRMEDAPTGRVVLRAIAMAPASSTMRSSRAVELTLAPGSETEAVLEFASDIAIRGTVVRSGGPVTGAMVSFTPRGRSEMGTMGRTDARGHYEVVGLEPGPHRVYVYGTGVSFSMDHAVTGSAELDIDVTGGAVSGRVVRADNGAPLAGVQVSFFTLGGNENTPAQSAITNAQGGFSQSSLSEGRYRLITSKAGFGQAEREVEVGRGTAAEVAFELQPADGVSLSVVDARDGRPLEAIVVVRDQGKRIVANRHSGVGDDGVLNIPLANGDYILSTSATGYGTATLPVRAPSQGLKVGLTPGGTLRIESPRDLRGRVRLVQPDGEEYVRCWCNGIAEIDLAGRLTTVENVTPGSYTVHVEGQGVSATRPVVVREGQVSTVAVE